jgi:Transglycosylase SLT domain
MYFLFFAAIKGETVMCHAKSLMIALLAAQMVAAAAIAGDRTSLRDPPVFPGKQQHSGQPAIKDIPPRATPLDRVAIAVDGAESSHGADMAMWRPDPSGPQGPMQVSEAAATDVGGGNRFDLAENRAIGRAYLRQLFWRYGNWPDAIAAYNWGMGKMNAWVKAGRPPDKFLIGVADYLTRVLHESGLCSGPEMMLTRQQPGRMSPAMAPFAPIGERTEEMGLARRVAALPPDSLVHAACSGRDAWDGAPGFGARSGRFAQKLDQAMQLAFRHVVQGR